MYNPISNQSNICCQSYLFTVGLRFQQFLMRQKIIKSVGGALIITGTLSYVFYKKREHPVQLHAAPPNPKMNYQLPSREQQMKNMMEQEYDLLVIGGGATGTGCALDAASRGIKVAMVERNDFSSGTSCKSTKLVHGGVRYLEKAFWGLDKSQYDLVREALAERATILKVAPYLATQIPIMCPIYKAWQLPYYWVGCKLYDLVAGKRGLESSYYLSKTKALKEFPMLKDQSLVGAVVYYDGQQNDSRMNVMLALTAAYYGASIANHVQVLKLLKDSNNKLCGAEVEDTLTGNKWTIKAKGIINATGPFVDQIREMDDISCKKIISGSSGTHIVLPEYYSPEHMGLIDPSTSDGRVIFFLPWEGNSLAGTTGKLSFFLCTDKSTSIVPDPVPTEDEIMFILNEISHYLKPGLHRNLIKTLK
jgi:glycerol-3-phosphate dehydrogenase